MEISYKNKVALVTGAASGFGLATAKMFAQAGAKVMLCDIDEELLNESKKELLDSGLTVSCYKCDVSNEEQVKNIIEKTVKTFGRLDCAYNNVGIQAKVTAGLPKLSEMILIG